MFEFARLVQSGRRPAWELMKRMRDSAPAEFVQFPEEPVLRMRQALWTDTRGLLYMRKRGFDTDTLEHFGVGYSVKQDMVIVPMHDPSGMLIGFIGRSIEGKDFKNSDHLPKSKTVWNFHRAKRHGDTVIIVESSFDAMKIHQAGYPNVVALLGGSLSTLQIQQLDRTFSTIILMTDFDLHFQKGRCHKCGGPCKGHRPGRDLAWQIHDALPNKRVKWAVYSDQEVFPNGKKDATDLTDAEISKMLVAPIGSLEYRQLDYDRIAVVQ